MKDLTDRQKLILDFISASIRERGYPPTLREIGKHMGIKSTNGVSDHLRALKRKGYLDRTRLKSRALTLTKPEAGQAEGKENQLTPLEMPQEQFGQVLPFRRPIENDDLIEIPILGRVAAGQPILAVEDARESVKIDRFFLGPNTEVFALRVTGDSMIEAGILDGDFIFVRKQIKAKPGDIVVAMIDEEATVKYFYPEGDRIRFQPANARLDPIIVRREEFRETQILGIVVGVYRRL
jgi:repressor LexA